MKRVGLAFVAAAAIAARIGLGGCSVVTSYDGFTADGTTCGKRFPARPAAPTSGSAGDKELVGVASDVELIDDGAGGPLGYDLDGLCTCPTDLGACRTKTGRGEPCDQAKGIDNATGVMLRVLVASDDSRNKAFTDNFRSGRHGLAVRVQGYNGGRDDPDVAVGLYNVVGVNGDADGGAQARFDGTDQIIVASDSTANPDNLAPQYVSVSGYVSGYTLVAPFAEFPFRLEIPPMTGVGPPSVTYIKLKAATFIGKLQKSAIDGGLAMTDTQLVGRLRVLDILEQLQAIHICRDGGFDQAKAQACAALDLPLNAKLDGKDVPCDALSFALGVRIKPAKITGFAPARTQPNPCGTEPIGTCED